MMPRKTRNGLVLLSVLSVVSFWFSGGSDKDKSQPIAGLDTRLDYALKEFEARYFDVDGRPLLHLWSPNFSSEAATGESLVSYPKLELHHAGFLWNIIADAARVTGDKELIFLSGDVNIHRSGEAPDSWLVIKTSEVTLEVTPQIASSRTAVEILDASGTLAATGFTVNMQNSHFQLDNQVTATYVIN